MILGHWDNRVSMITMYPLAMLAGAVDAFSRVIYSVCIICVNLAMLGSCGALFVFFLTSCYCLLN